MSNTITIAPVTRVEGHGKVTIHMNDAGEVEESHFHVVEFRGFEKFCEGRLLSEMPVITTRACGICPVSHHLAAAKACDDALGVEIPPAAKKLRELMHMGQMMHSHALHFFFLAAPDFILGPDADPAMRNVVGLVGADPELAKKAITLRRIGQEIVTRVGGRKIHPVTAIPGGMSKPLTHEERYESLQEIDEAISLAQLGLEVGKSLFEKYADLIPNFAVIKTNYMGLVKKDNLELYDGTLRLIDAEGNELEQFDPKDYLKHIGEHVEDWSYLKFPFYKKLGWPNGVYRVAPLARLNVAKSISTPLANQELKVFKKLGNGGPVHETLYFHYARLIELLYAAERAKELLEDDEIVSKHVRVKTERKEGEGIGVIEAPRGTLIHHYQVDAMGKVVKANLIVATIHNNPAMDRSVNEVAKKFVKGNQISEGALNMVEMAVRCYDPCLSCATHAVGQMPLSLELYDAGGTLVDVIEKRS
ncbi:MAG TPA: Ni/Fe hydrogenase subunit alpha [bacterium]|nr:Ni/Fe hydrogenase subunit alpha [bacterium]